MSRRLTMLRASGMERVAVPPKCDNPLTCGRSCGARSVRRGGRPNAPQRPCEFEQHLDADAVGVLRAPRAERTMGAWSSRSGCRSSVPIAVTEPRCTDLREYVRPSRRSPGPTRKLNNLPN